MIELKPVAAAIAAAPLTALKGKTLEATKAGADVKCNEYPTGVVAGLGIVVACLIAPLAVVFLKIRELHSVEESEKEMTPVTSPKPASRDSQAPLAVAAGGTEDPSAASSFAATPLRNESIEAK